MLQFDAAVVVTAVVFLCCCLPLLLFAAAVVKKSYDFYIDVASSDSTRHWVHSTHCITNSYRNLIHLNLLDRRRIN